MVIMICHLFFQLVAILRPANPDLVNEFEEEDLE
jgi:hypothetical protein